MKMKFVWKCLKCNHEAVQEIVFQGTNVQRGDSKHETCPKCGSDMKIFSHEISP